MPPRPRASLGELLGAFAFASDLAFGLQLEDSLRSCYLATRLAEHLGVPGDERVTVYYTALLKDAGCTSWTGELARTWQTDEIAARRDFWIFTDRSSYSGIEAWMRQYVAADLPELDREPHFSRVLAQMPETIAGAITDTALVARRIAQRLGMPPAVELGMLHLFEQWDGGGAPAGLKGTDIPLASRIVLPTFIVVPVNRVHGRDSALATVRASKGGVFDPDVIDALEELAESEEFWDGLNGERIRERVLAMEPESPLSDVGEERVEEIALAFADFIDLKSRYAAAHSRRVGKIAEQLARLMNCSESSVAEIRRAALMHDLGLVSIPSYTLEKPEESLTEAEWEKFRLHPYHAERILRRVPPMSHYAEMVGNHHERMDGSGYYRGLSGNNVSLGARIIAVADRLDELTHEGPGREAMDFERALSELEDDRGLDPAIVSALRKALGREVSETKPAWPAGLTDREVQVLRGAARGLTRAQIGAELKITENTVRHHLEHIYAKTGTSTRVTATLFAIENGLMD